MSFAGSIIQGASSFGAAALTSAANAAIANHTNKTNVQIANDTNQANRDIADSTNQANRDLANQQFQHEVDMWNMNNEYNDPSAQVQRIAAAGINPLTAFSNGGNAGNSSAPPLVPDMANQVTGAPMVAPTVDPLTIDQSLCQSILAFANNMTNRYNAETARMKTESDINVNEWSVKSVQQQIQNMKTQNDIDLQMLPYMLKEKEAVIRDLKSSRKLKDKQRESIDTTIKIGQSQIFKNFADVVAKYLELDIMQQNADTNSRNADINQQNADTAQKEAQTHAEQVANSYDIALKQYQAMSLQQLLDYSKNFFSDDFKSNTFGASGSISSGFGSGSGSGLGSRVALPGINFNVSGTVENSDTNSNTSRSLNVDKAIQNYGRLAAYNVQLLEYINNPGVSAADKSRAIEVLSKTGSLLDNNGPYLNHRIRAAQIYKQGLKNLLQFPTDGIINPLNSSDFPQ